VRQEIRQEACCPLCGSAKTSEVSGRDRRGEPLVTRLCEDCGLVFNDPVPSDEELFAFYSRDYRRDYKGAKLPRVRQVVRNFARVEGYLADNWPLIKDHKRVLDAGSGSGEFVFLADKLGLTVLGVEPNQDYSAYCRDVLGVKVETESLFAREFAPGSFDFIRLNHVLEHINDPVAALKTLASWLADDGLLYVEVPNIESYAAEKSRGNIFHYGHIYNFNPWTLRVVAARAGLVEAKEAADRQDGSTGVFFRKGVAETTAANPDNARRVSDAILRHYSGSKPISARLGKLWRKLSLRIAEQGYVHKLKDHKSAGDYFADRLRKRLAAA